MQNSDKIFAEYQANEVVGRGAYCPVKKGIYKIMRLQQGDCYEKPALMAIALWKLNKEDTYSLEMRYEIQMESFKLNAKDDQLSLFEPNELLYREIIIHDGSYSPGNPFILNFDVLEKVTPTLDEIDFCFDGCGFSTCSSESQDIIDHLNALTYCRGSFIDIDSTCDIDSLIDELDQNEEEY